MAVPDEAEAQDKSRIRWDGSVCCGCPGPPRSCASGFVQDGIVRARPSDRLPNGSAVKLRAQLNQVQAGTACTP